MPAALLDDVAAEWERPITALVVTGAVPEEDVASVDFAAPGLRARGAPCPHGYPSRGPRGSLPLPAAAAVLPLRAPAGRPLPPAGRGHERRRRLPRRQRRFGVLLGPGEVRAARGHRDARGRQGSTGENEMSIRMHAQCAAPRTHRPIFAKLAVLLLVGPTGAVGVRCARCGDERPLPVLPASRG